MSTLIPAPTKFLAVIAIAGALLPAAAWGKDHWTLNIPLRSRTSPVQRMNRDGVEEVKKGHYEKAEELFNKAYLLDPSDPFTLNNLGYVAELQGQLDRAHQYYQLATQQGCDAPIDESSMQDLKGKPMQEAYASFQNLPMRINRMNIDAIRLVQQDRGFAAMALLENALKLDPQNPFTLNNLGVAYEALGDYQDALKNYTAVADLHSSEPVVVTQDRAWRGKPVSDMARDSAKRLRNRMQTIPADQLEAMKYNVRGVFEENANEWQQARQDFLRAYAADPNDAFSLNNRGYVAERDGDLETAQFYYGKAWQANDAHIRVGLATNGTAEGKTLFAVANGSDQKVDRALQIYSRERRSQPAGPVELTPRGPGATQAPSPSATPQQPSNGNTPPTTQPGQIPNR
jgi:Flp pilus assembly protein TadD